MNFALFFHIENTYEFKIFVLLQISFVKLKGYCLKWCPYLLNLKKKKVKIILELSNLTFSKISVNETSLGYVFMTEKIIHF